MSFCQKNGDAGAAHIMGMCDAINQGLRGETYNTVTVIFAAGETQKNVQFARCGVGKMAILCPIDSNAAASNWHMAAMKNGSMTLSATGSGERKFICAVLGAGGNV